MSNGYGHFEGEVIARWLKDDGEDDRTMKLVEDFCYVDPAGKRWEAGAGRRVNGASIPGSLWSTVGAPYVGDYRRASVVHDVACEDQSAPTSDEVHLMFYNAMRCDGVGAVKAWTMYEAVAQFGPSWPVFRTAVASEADIRRLGAAVERAVDELGETAEFETLDRRIGEIFAE